MRRSAVLALVAAAAILPAAPARPQSLVEVNLEVVGRSDLGGGTGWDDVAVAGTTAVVTATPGTCPGTPPKVVDLKDARHPRPVADLPLPAGLAVVDLDAHSVATPAFTGDLVVVTARACPGGGPGGILYYDLAEPSQPRLLARIDRGDVAGVSIASRPDGRVVVVTAAGSTVTIDEATDPARPATVAHWGRPAGDGSSSGGCPPVTASVALDEGGEQALVVFGDGAVYDLALDDPARIELIGHAAPNAARRAAFAAVLPVGRRTLGIVSEEDCPAVAAADGRGLRLLALDRQAAPAEAGEVRLPSPAAPGRLVASGELAFVAWHADGLRVVDLGQVTPKVVAQFIPPSGDAAGVALLPDAVVVTEAGSGLYVLVRPDEGSPESLWQKLKNAAGFMIFPLGGALLVTVPRLVMGHQGARSRSPAPAPTPARVPRRR